MKIAGFQKNSLVDYRGKVAAVVFVPFCNFNCYYCHNRHLLGDGSDGRDYSLIDEKDVFSFLEKRVGLIGGVVITGGEPTLQQDLMGFSVKVKQLGYPVKLDTNGSRPDVIEALLGEGLLDFIAMDLKAPFDRYDEMCGVMADIENIRESIGIILSSGISHEFRTTVVPSLDIDDIVGIAKLVKGADTYSLQQFRKPAPWRDFADIRNMHKPHGRDFFDETAELCRPYVNEVITRGVNL